MQLSIITVIIQLFLGATIAFMGANIFRSMPAVGGFILGAVVGLNVAHLIGPPTPLTQVIGFFAGGAIGALISIPLQIVIIVLSGSALGALAGALLGYLVSSRGIPRLVVEGMFISQDISPLQGWMMVLFALIFGGLSIRFEEGMLTASTGFLGAFAAIAALSKLGASAGPIFSDPIFLFFAWAALGLIATIWQNYNRSD